MYQVVIDTNVLVAALRSNRGASHRLLRASHLLPLAALLRDPKDDFVLELAVESRADFLLTFNVRDFEDA